MAGARVVQTHRLDWFCCCCFPHGQSSHWCVWWPMAIAVPSWSTGSLESWSWCTLTLTHLSSLKWHLPLQHNDSFKYWNVYTDMPAGETFSVIPHPINRIWLSSEKWGHGWKRISQEAKGRAVSILILSQTHADMLQCTFSVNKQSLVK